MVTAENKPVMIEKEYKFATQIFIFTVLFAITAVGVYLSFLVCDRTLLRNGDGNIDGIAQAYPVYVYLKHFVEDFFSGNGISGWSWEIGLGASNIDYFKSKLLNPLTCLIIAFPEEHIDIGYNIANILRQYLSGIAFMFFAKGVNLKQSQRIIGAICYTFSGWIIMATTAQGSFTNATIILPLLILGAEKIIRKESPVLFVVAIVLFFITGVLWAYIAGITVLLYYVVRLVIINRFNEKQKGSFFIKEFVAFIGYGIIGILISSCLVISILSTMTGAVTNTESDGSSYLYTLKDYLTVTAGFFEFKSIHTPYSIIFIPVICIILLPLLAKNLKGKSAAAILSISLFFAGLLPVTGSIFNGFGYSVGRWYFVLAFFMVWASMECMESENLKNRKNFKIITVWLLALALWNIVICYFVLKIINENAMLATVIGVVFGLIIVALLYIREHKIYEHMFLKMSIHRIINVCIVMILIGSIIGAANMTFYPGVSDLLYKHEKTGSIFNKFSGSTQQVAVKLEDDDKSFFRTDQVDGYNDQRVARMIVNENIYWGYRSIYSYFSTISSKWLEFNKTMGNNCGYFDRTISFSNDNRASLDFLMGVKYFLGDSETKRPGASEYAPYGFKYDKTIDGVDVLKNEYNIGLGTVYNKYITESELLEYDTLEREQILMQAAVVSDKETEKLSNVVHENTNALETDIKKVNCSITEGENIKIDGPDRMTVYKGGGSFKISVPDIKESQVFVTFKNLKRDKCDYETKLELSGKSFDTIDDNPLTKYINKVSYEDDEKFKIFVTKGNIEKAAINNKGKNQGFNDVVDFNINLGYYDSLEGDIDVFIDNFGNYSFEEIAVYAMPMDIYNRNAKLLENKKYNITEFDNDYVDGYVNSDKDGILYLSISDADGWHVYIDGKEAEKISNVNIGFTGVEISAGEHRIELKYSYPGIIIGVIATIAGIVALFAVVICRRRLKKQ
ncbi:MAG: YfhO family protein [Bacillota bacterium]|nr:YfhO family protein [Bacillota bacterium]